VNDYDGFLDDLARRQAGEVAAAALDLRLWALVKDGQRAEARTRRHPAGIELVVMVDGDLHAAEAFTPAAVEGVEAAAERYRLAFLADGWNEAGPRG
jgi:hypothetical protein